MNEIGYVKDDNNGISGFFISDGDIKANKPISYVRFDEFVKLVVNGEIEGLYYDTGSEQVLVDRECDEMKKLKKIARKAYDKLYTLEDWLEHDMVFNMPPSFSVCPASLLDMNNVLNASTMVHLFIYCGNHVDGVFNVLTAIKTKNNPVPISVNKGVDHVTCTIDTRILFESLEALASRGVLVPVCVDSYFKINSEDISKLSYKLVNKLFMRTVSEDSIREVLDIVKLNNDNVKAAMGSGTNADDREVVDVEYKEADGTDMGFEDGHKGDNVPYSKLSNDSTNGPKSMNIF